MSHNSIDRSVGVSILFAAALAAAAPAKAQVVRQIASTHSNFVRPPAMDDAGADVYAATGADPLGTNGSHAYQLFRFSATTGAATQVTASPASISDANLGVSVSDDGQWVAFLSDADLTGGNHDRSTELFVSARDGTGLQQLTSVPGTPGGDVLIARMAGAGGRVAFVSDANLTGANPGRHQQIFLIDRTGGNLAQVTSFTDGEIDVLSVSDDATRIAFSSDGNPTGGNADGSYELFAINADGTSLRQLTSSTPIDEYDLGSVWANLSGNGAKIAFQSRANPTGGNADGSNEIFIIDWAGTNLRQLTNSTSPSSTAQDAEFPAITDDATTVFFTSDAGTTTVNPDASFELWKINADGTGKTLLGDMNRFAGSLVVSGSGNRLAYSDADGNLQVCDGAGANVHVLVSAPVFTAQHPEISPDGTRIAFVSTGDLVPGSNPDGSQELFTANVDGSGLAQLTVNQEAEFPSLPGDNSVIFFSGTSTVTHNEEIWRINPNGTGLTKLTTSVGGFSQAPVVSENGAVVVFTSLANLAGSGNADHSGEIYKMNPNGTGIVQLTSTNNSALYNYFPQVDATGTWCVFGGNANPSGGNPTFGYQVWRMKLDKTVIQQLTSDPTYYSAGADISGDGNIVVFYSEADLVGTNTDHNVEIFLWSAATSTFRQLTNTVDADNYDPTISRDGRYVYFISTAPFFEANPSGGFSAYRVEVATGTIERVDGLGLLPGYETATGVVYAYRSISVSDDGSVAAAGLRSDPVQGNPDRDVQIFVYDRRTAPSISVSPGPAPTTISWLVESGPVRYDVIRGDVANLANGGSTVNLGAVTCVENDSVDTTTAGSEDPTTPAPGHAFFYLYRGSQGLGAGPGSYGTGSGNKARTAASGDCGS